MRPWIEIEKSPEFQNADPRERSLFAANFMREMVQSEPDLKPEIIGKVGKEIQQRLINLDPGHPENQAQDRHMKFASTAGRLAMHVLPFGKYLTEEGWEDFKNIKAQPAQPPTEDLNEWAAAGFKGPRPTFSGVHGALPTTVEEEQAKDIIKSTLDAELFIGGGYVLKGLGYLGAKSLEYLADTRIIKAARQALHNSNFGKHFTRVSQYMQTPQGQAFVKGKDGMMNVQADWFTQAGLWDEGLRLGGVFDLSQAESRAATAVFRDPEYARNVINSLSREAQIRVQKAVDSWMDVSELIFKDFVGIGGKVKMPNGKWVEPKAVEGGYLPRMLRPELKKEMGSEIERFLRLKQRVAAEGNFLTEAGLDDGKALWDATWAKFLETKPKDSTMRAVHFALDRGTARSEGEAMNALSRSLEEANSEVVGFFKHLERPRVAKELPPEFYAEDFGYVTREYVIDAAKRMSEISHWGQGEKPAKLYEMIRKIPDANEQEVAWKTVRAFTQRWPLDARPSVNFREWADGYTAVNVATRIGAGLSSVPNAMQPLISSFMEAGWTRGAKSLYQMLTSGEARTAARVSGSNVGQDAMRLLAGYDPGTGKLRRMTDTLLEINLFNKENRAWNALSATVGKNYAEDLAQIAVGKTPWKNIPLIGDKRIEWAKRSLGELGVDMSKMSKDGVLPIPELQKAMYNFASKSQLQHRVFDEPLIMNSPYWKYLFLFKRFGVKQFYYAKDVAVGKFLENPMPLLRLMAGGFLGGEFVVHGRHLAGELMRWGYSLGKDPVEWAKDRRGTRIVQRALENFAAIGTLGMITDLGWPSKDEEYGVGQLWRNVASAVAPVQLRDAADIKEVLMDRPAQAGTFPELLEQLGKGIAGFSPLGREALKEE
jgi:hypothetical protein